MNLLLSLGGGGPESGGPPFEDATAAVVDSKDAADADVASPEDLLQEAMALERANANLAAGLDELAAWRDGVEEKVDALGKVPGRYLVSSGSIIRWIHHRARGLVQASDEETAEALEIDVDEMRELFNGIERAVDRLRDSQLDRCRAVVVDGEDVLEVSALDGEAIGRLVRDDLSEAYRSLAPQLRDALVAAEVEGRGFGGAAASPMQLRAIPQSGGNVLLEVTYLDDKGAVIGGEVVEFSMADRMQSPALESYRHLIPRIPGLVPPSE